MLQTQIAVAIDGIEVGRVERRERGWVTPGRIDFPSLSFLGCRLASVHGGIQLEISSFANHRVQVPPPSKTEMLGKGFAAGTGSESGARGPGSVVRGPWSGDDGRSGGRVCALGLRGQDDSLAAACHVLPAIYRVLFAESPIISG